MKVFNIVMVKDPLNLMHSFWKRNVHPTKALERYYKYYTDFWSWGCLSSR